MPVHRRKPAVAGLFYPSDREELVKSIRDSFLHPLGPGVLPDQVEPGGLGRILGYVVPHAGYMYSGPVAAHAYLDLARAERPDVIVIAGPNHNMIGLLASVYREGVWETPLGDVEVDAEIARLLVSYSKFFGFDADAHAYEHSIEVQLPFLQYVLGEFKFVPVSIGLQTLDVARDLGRAAARLVEENGVKVMFLASTDFNHYEPHDVTVEKDAYAIEAILSMDEEELYRRLEERNVTMCGPAPTAALITYAGILGYGKPVLLKHATSGDVTGEKEWVVGYASIRVPAQA